MMYDAAQIWMKGYTLDIGCKSSDIIVPLFRFFEG